MSVIPVSPHTDQQRLLEAVRRGDERAQRQLYRTHYAFARGVALHYGGGTDEVEDIVQDAFIKLFATLRRFPIKGSFRAWFRRIVANTAIDHYRTRHRRRGLLSRFLAVPRTHSSRNAAERSLADDDIAYLLRRLPPARRMVFSLYVLEGYNHPEIAERLGISVGTSKSNLARARRQLATLAEPYLNLPKTPDHE